MEIPKSIRCRCRSSILVWKPSVIPAQQTHQAPMLRSHRINFSPAGQEVMVDPANHRKAIRHNLRVGKNTCAPAPHSRWTDPCTLPAPAPYPAASPVRCQRRCAAPQNYIQDPLRSQIAERGGISILPGGEMLIDPQHPRAGRPMAPGATAYLSALASGFGSAGTKLCPCAAP